MSDHLDTDQKIPFFDRVLQRVLRAPVGTMTSRRDVPVKIPDVIRIYWQSLRKHPKVIAFVLLTSMIGGFGSLIIPLIFKNFLDTIATTEPIAYHSLFPIIWLLFFVGVLRWLAWRSNFIVMGGLASKVIADLKQRAFAYLTDHSDRFFISTFTGSLVQRVNRLASSYDRLADRLIYDIIPIIIQVVGAVIILWSQNKLITLVIAIWIIVFICWNYFFARWKLKYDIARAEADSRSTGYLADSITNHQTVELNGSHSREKEGYSGVTDRQALLQRFSWQSASIIDGIQAFLVLVVEFAIFYIGVQLWSEGNFSIGLFVLAHAYVAMLSDKLWTFSRMVRDIHESFADAKEMVEIMLLPHEITEKNDAVELGNVNGRIEFHNVSFSIDGKNILENISFTVEPGERVALVGPSGAGKSTIVKLLFRQYDPTSGEILIDGTPIREVTLNSLRNALCLVPQEPMLFHRSLFDNIRYPRPDASREEVEQAAEAAHATDFIMRSPSGYETFVGERGIKLSGGERQRIAVARAFIKGSTIVVFDEATSSLDSESEQKIQNAFDALMMGRTTVVIAHRLSTIRRMDRIIVVDEGKISEMGSHDELLNAKKVYYKLWNLQQGGFIASEI
jgi:ATP-binding cassette subfamily B protein